MKELKCITCSKHWYIDEADETENMFCTYCGKALPKDEEIVVDSFDKALLKVIRLSGAEILKDKNKLIAYLSDIAPAYDKELRIFRKSCSNTLLEMFYASSRGDDFQRKQAVGRARQILLDEEGLSDKWTDTVVNALTYALAWEKTEDVKTVYVQPAASENRADAGSGGKAILYDKPDRKILSGTAVATGDSGNGRCSVENWKDIISIAGGGSHTVGLRKDGTVAATGKNICGQCNVQGWRDIIAISAGSVHTVGLRKDGTVAAAGDYGAGRCNVGNWRDIISISAGDNHTVGLRKDGTVAATGNNSCGQCNICEWRDIAAIACGAYYTIGLRKDGTVVAAGENRSGRCNVEGWRDIAAVTCGLYHTAGLKKDGTVIATAIGHNNSQYNLYGWKDIIAIACGAYHIVGLKKDGTAVAAGKNGLGQCNVEEWRDIIAVSCGSSHTVGIKKNGAVI